MNKPMSNFLPLPNVLHDVSPLTKVSADVLEALYTSIHEAIRAFVVQQNEQPTPASSSSPIVFLDFSRDRLIRRDRRPIRLLRCLATHMLAQFARHGRANAAMSLARFLLCPRERQSVGYQCGAGAVNAFRRQGTELRQILEDLDLAVGVPRRKERRLLAHFGPNISTNIMCARSFGREAFARLKALDFVGAVEFARLAFSADFDSAAAGSVISRVLQAQPDLLTSETVVRTEAYFARRILNASIALRRVRKTPDIEGEFGEARIAIERLLIRLRKQWIKIGNWPFSESPNDNVPRHDHRTEFREFLDIVIKAIGDDGALAWSEFSDNLIVSKIVAELVSERVKERNATEWSDLVRNLTGDVLEHLLLDAWQPKPALSHAELIADLRGFLRGRIKWKALLGRGKCRADLDADGAFDHDDNSEDDEDE
jgi:hypothetical protein